MMAFAESNASQSCRSGTLLDGKYRLRRRLDEGGMSWVWLAQHEVLGMPVAIKIARPVRSCALEPLAEGRMVAKLRHPSIVSVLDSGLTPRGDQFLVMEHLVGSPLSFVLQRDSRLSPRAAVQLLAPIVDALAFCHERGVVHRDVKPSNIFLARHRGATHAKLLDFGVAQWLGARDGSGRRMGTAGYMAPEQVQRRADSDHRVDIWAFCAVLYEAIAGRPALEAKTFRELLKANAEPEVVPLIAQAADGLWPILERGLRSDPSQRYQSAQALRTALDAWLDSAKRATSERGDEASGVRLRYSEPAPRPEAAA